MANSKEVNERTQGGALQGTERLVLATVGLGLTALGVTGNKFARVAGGGTGLLLLGLAATGRNPLANALKVRATDDGEVLIRDAVTIGQPPETLYARWRQLKCLPELMSHLKEVRVTGGKRSHWVVAGPVGDVEWDAELTADEPGRRLAWASVPGAALENSGEVIFRPAPGDRGTELVVRLKYRAPGGTAGVVVARLRGEEPAQQLRDDLMRFKREQELGFHPTTEGQSSGRADSGRVDSGRSAVAGGAR